MTHNSVMSPVNFSYLFQIFAREQNMFPTLAFLGPNGTYSHQAAHDRFGNTVCYSGQQTITDVYDALCRGGCHLALIPQENSIFGIVIETYDLYRRSECGRDVFIRDEVALNIQHCLLVQKGTRLEDIRQLLSHEQALGQCRRFIEQHLGNASLVKTPSTMAAVEAVLSDESRTSAAIASKLSATLFDGLEVLQESIQNENSNFTRFFVLTDSLDGELPSPSTELRPSRALFRINSRRSTVDGAGSPTITQLLDALQLRVTRVDRRPCLDAKSLNASVYFVEVEDDESLDHISRHNRFGTSVSWAMRLKMAGANVVEAGGDIVLLGRW